MALLADRLARFAAVLRRVIGAPDYELYVGHVRLAHPGQTPLTHEEFVKEFLSGRYGKGPGRCC